VRTTTHSAPGMLAMQTERSSESELWAAIDQAFQLARECLSRRFVGLERTPEIACRCDGGVPSSVTAQAVNDPARVRSICAPGKIVRRVVSGFADAPFTFADLCNRIDAEYPGVLPDRRVISRRLYQLRSGKAALVKIVEPVASSDQPDSTQNKNQRLYQYVGTS
jgi:hypothetical protein